MQKYFKRIQAYKQSSYTATKANELTFQNDMIRQLLENGWLLGQPENYNRELALYSEDILGFVHNTQSTSKPDAAIIIWPGKGRGVCEVGV